MKLDMSAVLQPLTDRWDGLPTRDRRALAVLMVSAGLLLVWFGVINPVATWRAEAAAELETAEETYQTLVTRAPEAMATASAGTASGTTNLNTELRRQANRFGLSIQSFEPDGDLLRVRIDEARGSNVMRWLAALESTGIVTEQITLEARDQPGLISVRGSFRR